MKLNRLLASLFGFFAFTAAAQLNSSVSVEGEYKPLVIETDRLNTFPSAFKFELPPVSLEYDYNGVVSDFRPGLLTMGATGRFTNSPYLHRRGYVDFRMGSYLDTRLDAKVYILNDSVNILSANIGFRSSSLFRPETPDNTFTRLPIRRVYDGKIGIDYSRLSGKDGLLKVTLSYRPEYFNYYGTSVPTSHLNPALTNLSIPTQTLNQGEAAVGFRSSTSMVSGWHAESSVSLMGFRRFWLPVEEGGYLPGGKETILKVGGGYAFNFGDFNALAVDAEGSFLFYPELNGVPERRNYGIINLKPGYRFVNNALSLTAGLDIAFSYDAMGKESGEKFGTAHLAPNIAIAYKSQNGIGISLAARGGVTPSTLHLREQFDSYCFPELFSTLPLYSPVDAKLGFDFGPFSGFSARLALRYAVAKNTPLGGWYQIYLGSPISHVINMNPDCITDPYSQTVDLSGLDVELDIHYSLGSLFAINFDGVYTPQSGTEGIFNGFDRPRWVLGASAEVKPWDRLKIKVGYNYRGVRNCYFWSTESRGKELSSYSLPDITDLNAEIRFKIIDNLEIYCKGENLLNNLPYSLPGLQNEGLAILGGLYFEF